MTTAGVPDEENTTVVSDSASANTTATATAGTQKDSTKKDTAEGRGIWTPPSGGISRALIGRIVGLCIGDEAHGIAGVAGEVFDGLERLQGLSRSG